MSALILEKEATRQLVRWVVVMKNVATSLPACRFEHRNLCIFVEAGKGCW